MNLQAYQVWQNEYVTDNPLVEVIMQNSTILTANTKTLLNKSENSKKKRDITIDIIKGIGIILMVVRHARAPYSEFVLLFHMAIFFIASGYLYKDSYSDTIKSLKNYVVRKIKGLWLPYFLYTVLFILLHNVLINLNIYTNNPQFLLVQGLENNAIKEYMTLPKMCKEIIKAVFFRADTQLGGAFWFFEILFFTLIIYAVVDFIAKKIIKKNKNYRLILQSIISFVFLLAGYYCYMNKIFLGGYTRILSVYCLIYIGVIFKEFSLPNRIFSKVNSLLIIVPCLAILIIAKQFGSIDLGNNNIKDPLFFLVVSIAGFFMLYGIAIILQKFSNKIICCIVKAIAYISKRSVSIIALHFLCFKIVSFIGVLALGMDSYMLAAFPVLFQDGAYWLAYTIVGITLPLLADALYLKIKKLFLNKVHFSKVKVA